MDEVDYQAELSLLLDEIQDQKGDAREILMRLQQMIATMRAEGMPVPDDLKKLMADLDREFSQENGGT